MSVEASGLNRKQVETNLKKNIDRLKAGIAKSERKLSHVPQNNPRAIQKVEQLHDTLISFEQKLQYQEWRTGSLSEAIDKLEGECQKEYTFKQTSLAMFQKWTRL